MHANGHTPHILVIDHTPEIQFLFQELLGAEPWRSTILAECPQSVDEVARFAPDVIVHDYVPTSARSDLASLAGLAADPRTRHVPIVLCSATPTLDDVIERIDSLNLRVVAKPFAIDDVLNAIRQCLNTPIAQRPAPDQTGMEFSDSM